MKRVQPARVCSLGFCANISETAALILRTRSSRPTTARSSLAASDRIEPATYGLEILSDEESTIEDASSYKSTKSKLTLQLTPDSRKENKTDTQTIPDDLAEIAAAWPTLPSAIRSAIVAIVRSSNEQ